jgi:hypothetical protein
LARRATTRRGLGGPVRVPVAKTKIMIPLICDVR